MTGDAGRLGSPPARFKTESPRRSRVSAERSVSRDGSAHENREDSAGDKLGMRLFLKGTFIDARGEQEDTSLSPRALSDPGSEVSSGWSAHFAKERDYVACLSEQVSKTLSNKKRGSDGSVQSPTSDSDHGSTHLSSVGKQDRFLYSRTLPSSNSSNNNSGTRRPQQVGRMNPDELRHLVQKKTAEITDVLKSQRLTTALTSINEIPEQVGEVLQQSATDLVDEVHTEISVARDLIATSDAAETHTKAAERAAKSIAMVPEMIMASFESSFARAMSTVRIRVDDVIQGLEGADIASEDVVEQMWAIPQEVRQITRDAVSEASQESREKVVEKLDCVLQSFSEESDIDQDALWKAKRQIVAKVPKRMADTLRAAEEAAEQNVSHAVMVVQDNASTEVHGTVANRVVADTLLRAKVDQGARAESPRPDSLNVCNPGSVGHPELCSRACLYYPLGKCTNGSNCAFCHASHSKRATHLDKRHREMLKTIGFAERLEIVLPILKMKLANLECGKEVGDALSELSVSLSSQQPSTNKRRSKETRTLQMALKFMSVRSMLTLLHHTPVAEDSPEHVVISELLQKLRPGFSSRDVEIGDQFFDTGPRSSHRSGHNESEQSDPSVVFEHI